MWMEPVCVCVCACFFYLASAKPVLFDYACSHAITLDLNFYFFAKRPIRRPAIAANIDMRDPDSGWTALHFASRSGRAKFAEKLLEYKANVNALGPNGETPLHLAAGWGTKEMVGLLLQNGADKSMEYHGKMPYDIAKENLRQDNAKLLERWLPVGLGYSRIQELSAPPSKDYSEEPNLEVQAQLRTLDMKIRLSGREHDGLVHTYAKLAKLYRNSEPPRFSEAIEASKRIVEIKQHVAKKSKEDVGSNKSQSIFETAVAEAMNNLGELCHTAQRYDEAKRYLTGSLDIMEKCHGPEHARTMPPIINIGKHLLETSDFDASYEYLLRYLANQVPLHTNEMGTESAGLLEILDLLSYCCIFRKDYKSAITFCERANRIVKDQFGNFGIQMKERYEKTGFVFFCAMDVKGAQEQYQKGIDILRIHLNKDEFDEDVMRLENNKAVAATVSHRVM